MFVGVLKLSKHAYAYVSQVVVSVDSCGNENRLLAQDANPVLSTVSQYVSCGCGSMCHWRIPVQHHCPSEE